MALVCIFVVGIVLLATLALLTPFLQNVMGYPVVTGLLQGFGLGLIFVPLSTVAFATLPAALRTEATGLFNLMRNIRSSVGIAVVSSLLVSNRQANHAEILAHVTPFNRLFQDPDITRFWNPLTAAGRAALDDEITRQATIIAFIDDFKLMMITALVAIPLVLLLCRGRQASARPVAAD